MRCFYRYALAALSLLAYASAACPQPVARPNFIIAVWYQPQESWDTWRARGINTLFGLETQNKVTKPALVALAHAKGFYVIGDDPACDIVQVMPDEPDGAGAVPPALWQGKVEVAQRAGKQIIGNFDAWRAQYLPAADYSFYFKGLDWAAADYYPLNSGVGGDYLAAYKARLAYIMGLAGNRPFIAFIESSDQLIKKQAWANDPQWGPPPGPRMRGPAPDEFSAELKVAVDSGAKGVCVFPDVIGLFWEGYDGTTAAVAARMVTDFAALNARFNTPTPATVVIAPPPQPATQPATLPAVTVPPATGPPIAAAAPAAKPVWAIGDTYIPAPRSSRRVRVVCDGNPTPIRNPNPLWVGPGDPDPAGQPQWAFNFLGHDAMVAYGIEETFMVYNGTLNRALTYATRDAAGNPLRDNLNRPIPLQSWDAALAKLNWAYESGAKNPLTGAVNPSYCDPPDRAAAQMVGAIARTPNLYQPGSAMAPYPPLVLDLEGLVNFSPGTTTASKVKYLQQWVDLIGWVREGGGGGAQEVYVYFTDAVANNVFGGDYDGADPALKMAWGRFLNTVSGYCIGGYIWDQPAESVSRGGNAWHGMIGGAEAHIRKYAPQYAAGPKWYVLTPTYQIYWPQNALPGIGALNGKLIPFAVWCGMIDLLVDKGYNIYIWNPGGEGDDYKPYYAYAALHTLRPQGAAAAYLKALAEQNYRQN